MTDQPVPEKILSIMSRKLRTSYDHIRSRMAEAGLEGMDVSHGDILWQLYTHGPLSMTDLARRIGRDKSTVTALIGKMENRGLLRRIRDTADARIVSVALTEQGSGYKETFRMISHEILETLYRDFSEKEKEDLARLLIKLGES